MGASKTKDGWKGKEKKMKYRKEMGKVRRKKKVGVKIK